MRERKLHQSTYRVRSMPVNEVVPYENNPRINDKAIDKVAESIQEYGFRQPIVVDENNVIIVGHTRLQAAKKLGIPNVPVHVAVGLSSAQIKAYRIADNKTHEYSEWDELALADEMEQLRGMEFDLSLTGFEADDIDQVLSSRRDQRYGDEELIPEVSESPVTIVGDVWRLGKHRVICGDCLDERNYTSLLQGEEVDLWVTDPPYNVAYVGKTENKLTIQNDSMSAEGYLKFLGKCFRLAHKNLKKGGCFYIWHASSEAYNVLSALSSAKLEVRQQIIWVKNKLILGRQDYHWQHEPCLYGWKDGAKHYWGSDRRQTTLLEFERPSRSEEYPTMKPVKLIEYIIKNSSRNGETVFDGFLGSGTTLIAAEKTGRVCYGAEIDPKYVDVVIKRWQDFTGEDAIDASGISFNDRTGKKD